jgi:hypothetical protein
VGQSAIVDSYNGDEMLEQSESLDSDEVRNDDGDEVVDPPDAWIEAEEHESLDEKLAAEISDEARDQVVSEDNDLDRIDPSVHGRTSGQIDGTPEDGDSFYNVER